MNLLALLAEKKVIDETVLNRAEEKAKGEGISYEQALISNGVSAESIRTAIGEYYDLPSREITEQEKIDPNVLRYIPEESARHYGIVPIGY
jgi:hypothetical protein